MLGRSGRVEGGRMVLVGRRRRMDKREWGSRMVLVGWGSRMIMVRRGRRLSWRGSRI